MTSIHVCIYFQIRTFHRECNGLICICGASVRVDDDVFTVDKCGEEDAFVPDQPIRARLYNIGTVNPDFRMVSVNAGTQYDVSSDHLQIKQNNSGLLYNALINMVDNILS